MLLTEERFQLDLSIDRNSWPNDWSIMLFQMKYFIECIFLAHHLNRKECSASKRIEKNVEANHLLWPKRKSVRFNVKILEYRIDLSTAITFYSLVFQIFIHFMARMIVT